MKECLEEEGQSELISIKTKKHKSLGVLSLVFMKLFFEKAKTLTIEEVVQFFAQVEKQDSDIYFKSQTRRLYDIANVLKSLGVIEKVKYFQPKAEKNQKERKNAFKWIGAKGFNLNPSPDDVNSA
jgi:transcription factor E2F7/8